MESHAVPLPMPDGRTPEPGGMWFTPVRSGSENLRFEYRPLSSESAAAQKAVSYDITVR